MMMILRSPGRSSGSSSYFVNAKPARAKDVQLLFADWRLAQVIRHGQPGRIGAIVGAKPNDRRALLEEAANITGLHSRRHEAELRLRGAETNLERLDDGIAGLTEQRDCFANRRVRPALPFGRGLARKAEVGSLLANGQPARQVLANRG